MTWVSKKFPLRETWWYSLPRSCVELSPCPLFCTGRALYLRTYTYDVNTSGKVRSGRAILTLCLLRTPRSVETYTTLRVGRNTKYQWMLLHKVIQSLTLGMTNQGALSVTPLMTHIYPCICRAHRASAHVPELCSLCNSIILNYLTHLPALYIPISRTIRISLKDVVKRCGDLHNYKPYDCM